MPYKHKDDKKRYHKEYHAEWYLKNRKDVRQKQKARRQEIKEWFQEYKKTICCSRCPENHPAALDFHHRDSSEKDGLVSVIVAIASSKRRILKEIAKCDVLCANCHRKLHWEELR